MAFPKKPTKVKNKNSKQQMLPSRHALNQVTQGDPTQRTMNQYAKATPGPADQTQSILTVPGLPMDIA